MFHVLIFVIYIQFLLKARLLLYLKNYCRYYKTVLI